MEKKFATVINCMDGRVQTPAINYIRDKYAVEYVDMITEIAPITILSPEDKDIPQRIIDKLNISIDKHNSDVVAVVGHHDCAGNPVDKSTQLNQINKSVAKVKNKFEELEVIGLWIDHDWQVHQVDK